MNQTVRVVVTLVHGTWARDSRWTRPGSKLCSYLEQNIPSPALFIDFPWSGRNSARAREIASLELCARLQKQIDDYPDAWHFVIGHSHGGNVALKAVERGSLFDRVGIICLSTPFFSIRPRFTGRANDMARLLGGMLALVWVAPDLLHLRFQRTHGNIAFILECVCALFILLCFRYWARAADQFAAQIKITIPFSAALIVIRVVGDEATAFIGAFQIATWLMTKLGLLYVSLLIAIAETVEKRRNFFRRLLKSQEWLLIVIAGLLILFDLLARVIYRHYIVWPLIDSYARSVQVNEFFNRFEPLGRIMPWIALGSVLPVLCLSACIMVGGFLPMGYQALLGILLYEVSVEPVPSGTWQLCQIEPADRVDGLMHSLSYENADSLRVVADWIKDKITSEMNEKQIRST